MIPDETPGMNTVLADAMVSQSNTKLLDATKPTPKEELADKTDTKDDDKLPAQTEDTKPARGVFKINNYYTQSQRPAHIQVQCVWDPSTYST